MLGSKIIVGLDIGYSNLKLVQGNGVDPPRARTLPAGAAPADRMSQSMMGIPDGTYVDVAGQSYVAGVEPDRFENWQRTLHEDYPSSAVYRALFNVALLLCESTDIDVLITGLPTAYCQDAKRSHALTRALMGEHRINRDTRVSVHEVQVLPQPVGAYLVQIANSEDAELIEEARVLVLDPGFFSFDWAVIDSGQLRISASGTNQFAVSTLLDDAVTHMQKELGTRISREKLERSLRLGRSEILVRGQPTNISELLERSAEQVARVAMEGVRQAVRREFADFDLILLTGGGADYYRLAAQQAFPSSAIKSPADPVLANAAGFYYFGCA